MVRPMIFGLLGGQREDLLATAADDDRDLRHGLGLPVDLAHPVVLAVVGELPLTPEAAHDVDGLAQALDAGVGIGLVDARDGIVVLQPAGADGHDEAPVGQQVDGGRLLGEHHRVPEVHTGDERPHLDGVGRRRRGHDRRHGSELVAEVIVDLEAHVAEIFGLLGQIGPLLRRAGLGGLGPELERTRCCHGANGTRASRPGPKGAVVRAPATAR
jgi:hypothetical protein